MSRPSIAAFVVAGLALAAVLAGVLSGFASSKPDGLEKVASEQGLDASARPHTLERSPVGDYQAEGIANDRLATGVAGLIGVAVCFGLAGGLFMLVRRREPRTGNGRE